MKTLIIVDMQNDFIDGSLANPAASAIVKPMIEFIKTFEGNIIFTQDIHEDNYLDTQEGRMLPIEHCKIHTHGAQIQSDLIRMVKEEWYPAHEEAGYHICSIHKRSFGDIRNLTPVLEEHWPDEIYICGTCTDICVISIALSLKAPFSETKMYCLKDLCAGLTPEKHAAALEVMRSCQIEVI